MIESFAFSDVIPYPRSCSIERKRYERRGARSAVAELGAQQVQTQHLPADDLDTETFLITGIVPRGADVERIRKILNQRGGREFTSIPFITR